jgi:hypothetical protein
VSSGGFPLSDQDVSELVTLAFALSVRSQTMLQELQSTLILRHPQVFETTLFVRSEARDLTNDRSDEFVVFGQLLLTTRSTQSGGSGGWLGERETSN